MRFTGRAWFDCAMAFTRAGSFMTMKSYTSRSGRDGTTAWIANALDDSLTVIDMAKAVDKAAEITDVRVETKSGGRSGDWSRESAG